MNNKLRQAYESETMRLVQLVDFPFLPFFSFLSTYALVYARKLPERVSLSVSRTCLLPLVFSDCPNNGLNKDRSTERDVCFAPRNDHVARTGRKRQNSASALAPGKLEMNAIPVLCSAGGVRQSPVPAGQTGERTHGYRNSRRPLSVGELFGGCCCFQVPHGEP